MSKHPVDNSWGFYALATRHLYCKFVLLMMCKNAEKATRALTIQSQPLCTHRSRTSLTPSVFSPSHIWMWVSVSGRLFSLPWGTAHPEGPSRRQRTERDREQRRTLSSLATINNLDDASSRVCRVTTCMKSTVGWLRLLLSAIEWIFTGLCCSELPRCQVSKSTVFEKFLFAIFWCLNKKLELRLTASHPFLALYMGSEDEIRWSTKLKMRR